MATRVGRIIRKVTGQTTKNQEGLGSPILKSSEVASQTGGFVSTSNPNIPDAYQGRIDSSGGRTGTTSGQIQSGSISKTSGGAGGGGGGGSYDSSSGVYTSPTGVKTSVIQDKLPPGTKIVTPPTRPPLPQKKDFSGKVEVIGSAGKEETRYYVGGKKVGEVSYGSTRVGRNTGKEYFTPGETTSRTISTSRLTFEDEKQREQVEFERNQAIIQLQEKQQTAETINATNEMMGIQTNESGVYLPLANMQNESYVPSFGTRTVVGDIPSDVIGTMPSYSRGTSTSVERFKGGTSEVYLPGTIYSVPKESTTGVPSFQTFSVGEDWSSRPASLEEIKILYPSAVTKGTGPETKAGRFIGEVKGRFAKFGGEKWFPGYFAKKEILQVTTQVAGKVKNEKVSSGIKIVGGGIAGVIPSTKGSMLKTGAEFGIGFGIGGAVKGIDLALTSTKAGRYVAPVVRTGIKGGGVYLTGAYVLNVGSKVNLEPDYFRKGQIIGESALEVSAFGFGYKAGSKGAVKLQEKISDINYNREIKRYYVDTSKSKKLTPLSQTFSDGQVNVFNGKSGMGERLNIKNPSSTAVKGLDIFKENQALENARLSFLNKQTQDVKLSLVQDRFKSFKDSALFESLKIAKQQRKAEAVKPLTFDVDTNFYKKEMQSVFSNKLLNFGKDMQFKLKEKASRFRKKPRGKPLFESQQKTSITFDIDKEFIKSESFSQAQKGQQLQQVLEQPKQIAKQEAKVITIQISDILQEQKPKQRTQLVMLQKQSQRQTYPSRQVQLTKQLQTNKFGLVSGTIQISGQKSRTGQRSRQAFAQPQAFAQATIQTQAFAQPQIFRQAFKQPQAFAQAQRFAYGQKSKERSLLRMFSPTTKRGFSPYKPEKIKTGRKGFGGLFSVSVRRFGTFKTIGTARTLQQAVNLGKQRVGTTLGATYKIQGGNNLPTPKGFYKKVSKKEGTLFIELPSQRISTAGEKKELAFYRQAKKSSKKKKGGKKK